MNLKKIVIVGPPGSGKSTLAKNLSKELHIPFHPEPFAENPFLSSGALYPNELITSWMILRMIREHNESDRTFLPRIYDTFPAYSLEVFLSDHEKQNVLWLLEEANIYESSLYKGYCAIIALRVSLETLLSRIRDRTGRNDHLVSVELNACSIRHSRYEQWLTKVEEGRTFLDPQRLLVLDGEEDVPGVANSARKSLDSLDNRPYLWVS